jgi:hypothetical protein
MNAVETKIFDARSHHLQHFPIADLKHAPPALHLSQARENLAAVADIHAQVVLFAGKSLYTAAL